MDKDNDLQYYQGVGRRKRASARVRLYPGTGKFTVNDLPMEEYFPRLADQRAALLPLETAGLLDTMNVSVKVQGGGVSGQAGAVRMGIARAISHRERGRAPGRAAAAAPDASWRLPDPRSAREGTQEARSEARAQGSSVHQALISALHALVSRQGAKKRRSFGVFVA